MKSRPKRIITSGNIARGSASDSDFAGYNRNGGGSRRGRRSDELAPQVQLQHGLLRQLAERPELPRGEPAARIVHHGEDADREALLRGDPHAGVEADVQLGEDERVAREARIFGRIRDDERRGLEQRHGVEAHAAGQREA